MSLFCAAIWRVSVSPLTFPFLNHDHVFSGDILLVCGSKYQYNCFCSWGWGLVIVNPCVSCIVSGRCNLSFFFFFIYSLINLIDVSMLFWMLANPLLPSFFDTYSLSTSSLQCKALCIVMSFLVHCSIFWSSLIHKNSPEYLTGRTAQVFISLMRFLLYSFVSNHYLVLLKYSFYFIFYLSQFHGVRIQYFQAHVTFLFS